MERTRTAKINPKTISVSARKKVLTDKNVSYPENLWDEETFNSLVERGFLVIDAPPKPELKKDGPGKKA